jgi:hypothetical protein
MDRRPAHLSAARPSWSSTHTTARSWAYRSTKEATACNFQLDRPETVKGTTGA